MVRKQSSARRSRGALCDLQPIELPKPAPKSKRSLARALQLRRTIREISAQKLSLRTLSDLLWAACGVNRKKGPFGIPGRTAASASNSQEIDVYVALKEGTYLYEPRGHRLVPAAPGDLRRLAIGRGQGNAGAEAPARLIYVVDIDKRSIPPGFTSRGFAIRRFSGRTTTSTRGSSRPTSIYLPLPSAWRPGSTTATGRRFLRSSACVTISACSSDRLWGTPTAAHEPAADLGYLLHKNLAKIGNEDHEHSCRR